MPQSTSRFLPAKCTIHHNPTGCSCTGDIEKRRVGKAVKEKDTVHSFLCCLQGQLEGCLLYACFHSYKQLAEAQTSCILPCLPSLEDTETAELFCNGSHVDREKQSPVNRKPHPAYNRGSGDVPTFSSHEADGISQAGCSWPSHIAVLQTQLGQLSFAAFHTSQQSPMTS